MWCEQAMNSVPAIYSRVVGTNHPLSTKLFLSGEGTLYVMKALTIKALTLQTLRMVCSCSCSCRDSASKRTQAYCHIYYYLQNLSHTHALYAEFESWPSVTCEVLKVLLVSWGYCDLMLAGQTGWCGRAETQWPPTARSFLGHAEDNYENWVNLWSIGESFKSIKSCESLSWDQFFHNEWRPKMVYKQDKQVFRPQFYNML